MFGAIGVLFVLPWLDTSKVRSMRYRPAGAGSLLIFIVTCLVLGCLRRRMSRTPRSSPGWDRASSLGDYGVNSYVWLSRLGALYYFAYFLLVTPFLGLLETPLPVPESISTPVLSHPPPFPPAPTASPEKKG